MHIKKNVKNLWHHRNSTKNRSKFWGLFLERSKKDEIRMPGIWCVFLCLCCHSIKFCWCRPPLTPRLVRRGSGMEPTMVAITGSASLGNGSGDNGGHHHRLWWVWQINNQQSARKPTPMMMVPRLMVAGATHRWARAWLASNRDKGRGGDDNNRVFPPAIEWLGKSIKNNTISHLNRGGGHGHLLVPRLTSAGSARN